MLSFFVGLGLLILIPLFLLAVVFDVLMLMLAFGWKALKLGAKIIFGALGVIGLMITLPIFMCILVLL